MFERVIAQTIQKITAETVQERSLIPLLDILQDDRIPSRIKPFFETEVHWWLYNEMLARGANKRFDYDNPELASLINYLEQVQFRHARFEREEFITVLDSAVKLIYNYLCRPQTTLKWYIFRGQPVKPLREVMLRFSAFVDYEYFRNVFIEWVDRKRAERPTFDAISATEFERVIRRTDDQILLNCTVEDLLDIMDPLFDFIGEGPQKSLPVDALIIFFDDKNIKKLVDQLEAYHRRGGEAVTRDEFVTLLDELLSSAEDEPEVDYSAVYQNDELDDVVREHLKSGTRAGGELQESDPQDHHDPSHYPQEGIGSDPSGDDYHPPHAHAEGYATDEPPARHAEWEGVTVQHSPSPHDPVVAEVTREPEGAYGGGERYELEYELEEPTGSMRNGFHVEASQTHAAEWEAGIELAGGERMEEAPLDEDASFDLDDDDDDPARLDALVAVDLGRADSDVADADVDAYLDLEWSEEDEQAIVEDVAPQAADDDDDTRVGEDLVDDDDDDEPYTPSTPALDLTPEPSIVTVAPQEPMSDVRRFIDAALERKVVKKIFAKDRASYEAALDRINDAATWRAASQALDELFIRYNVDPYSRTAIRFTDSVYGRYLRRG